MPSVPQISMNAHLARVVAQEWAIDPGTGRPRRPGQAPDPRRLIFQEVAAVRPLRRQPGAGLLLAFVYRSDRGTYAVESVAVVGPHGCFTGASWARSCSCPDFQKRRGAARDQIQGEARCCKHMLLATWLIQSWCGRFPEVPVPTEMLAGGAHYEPEPQTKAEQSAAVRKYRRWMAGEWTPEVQAGTAA